MGGVGIGVEGVWDDVVSVVRKVGSAPVLGPGLRVVRDDTIGAANKTEVGASAYDGGLPGVSSFDVRVRGAAAMFRGSGDQARQLPPLAWRKAAREVVAASWACS